jgi:phage baseplate assembly protein W
MSTLEKNIYANQRITSNKVESPVKSRAYRGISTVNPENKGFTLYDIALIKQDLINHFHIKVGEKLENPNFGTIIWDLLYEPLTDELKKAIANNVSTIVNYDPRVQIESVSVDTYESGILIDCRLTYLPYNISESMQLKFDEDNGLLS